MPSMLEKQCKRSVDDHEAVAGMIHDKLYETGLPFRWAAAPAVIVVSYVGIRLRIPGIRHFLGHTPYDRNTFGIRLL